MSRVIALVLVVAACVSPPRAPPPPPPTVAALPEPVRTAIDPILLRQVEDVRGLSLGGPLDTRTVTSAELGRLLREQAESGLPATFSTTRERCCGRWG